VANVDTNLWLPDLLRLNNRSDWTLCMGARSLFRFHVNHLASVIAKQQLPAETPPATAKGSPTPAQEVTPVPNGGATRSPKSHREAPLKPLVPPGSSPLTAKLIVTQTLDISTREDAKFKTRGVVQSDRDFPSLRLNIQCSGPITDGMVGLGGSIAMGTSWGIVDGKPNTFFYAYQSAQPPFGPATPIVFNFWSKDAIRCTQATTF
jgi:hypothetical protein